MLEEGGPSALAQVSNRSAGSTDGFNTPLVSELEVVFVGNKELQSDGTWAQVVTPAFENDGRMEVIVQTERTGAHAIIMYGPSGTSEANYLLPTRRLPWMLLASGKCPTGQGEIEGRRCTHLAVNRNAIQSATDAASPLPIASALTE